MSDMKALRAKHPLPWSIEYDNDVGPGDESFWEWWTLQDANGNVIAKFDDESTARLLLAALPTEDQP